MFQWLDRWATLIGSDLMQFLPALVLGLLMIVPAVKLLRRVGKSWAWALLVFFPAAGPIVFVWIVAYSRWQLPVFRDSN